MHTNPDKVQNTGIRELPKQPNTDIFLNILNIPEIDIVLENII